MAGGENCRREHLGRHATLQANGLRRLVGQEGAMRKRGRSIASWMSGRSRRRGEHLQMEHRLPVARPSWRIHHRRSSFIVIEAIACGRAACAAPARWDARGPGEVPAAVLQAEAVPGGTTLEPNALKSSG